MIPIDIPYRRLRDMSTLSFWLAHCRMAERVVIGFFVYTAALSLCYDLPAWQRAIALSIPLVLFALACVATCSSSAKANIAREWLTPAIVLGAYWQMGWFAAGHDSRWQDAWLSWDRTLLDSWGLRRLAERDATLLPSCFELSYLLLYAIPPACLGILYWQRARLNVDRFLMTFALGTLASYALLPLIAVESPRIAFVGQDLPAAGIWQNINLWILNRFDISTSVFPSGHVAVAFSSAFGMKRALPKGRITFTFLLLLAGMVFVATIYGRYHYAADGIASIIICLASWGFCEVYDRT